MNNSLKEKVKNISEQLVNCGEDYYVLKQSVDGLYDIFKTITGIQIDNLNNDKEIFLPSGVAISPSAAAHCLLELKRTAVFLRGIKKAIDTKIIGNSEPVRILYAGSGPYATLITPLLTMYKPENLKITILDINQTSLYAAKKLIKALELHDFIDDFILEDATVFKLDKDYDIVISETMQSCLNNEPQVNIMQNLIPQMNKKAIFIPERISVDANLRKPGKWNDTQTFIVGEELLFLKNIITIDKNSLDFIKSKVIVDIPYDLNGFRELLLYTTVYVYKDQVLGANDCSLNLPIKFYDFSKRYANSIEFWYSASEKPRIECKVIDFV